MASLAHEVDRLLDLRRRVERVPTADDALTVQPTVIHCGIPHKPGISDVQPLWLMHPIGGSTFCYQLLVQSLDPRRPVYGFEAASLLNPEKVSLSIPELAARYVESIRQVQAQGPYLLAGWCFGGLLAYEMAHLLQAQSCMVEAVILLDSHAPVITQAASAPAQEQLLQLFVQDLCLSAAQPVFTMDWAALVCMGFPGAVDEIHAQAIQHAVLPTSIHREALHNAFMTFTGHGLALEQYRKAQVNQDQVAGFQMLLFRATEQAFPAAGDLDWSRFIDPWLLKIIEVDADHYSITRPPAVEQVADHIETIFPILSVRQQPGV